MAMVRFHHPRVEGATAAYLQHSVGADAHQRRAGYVPHRCTRERSRDARDTQEWPMGALGKGIFF